MTLTPDQFRDVLDSSFDSEPPGRTVYDDLSAGRTRLRRRRVAIIGTGCAAVALAAGIGLALPDRGDPQTQVASQPVPQPTPSAEPTMSAEETADLVRACHDGNQSDRATAAIFEGGTPKVEGVARTDSQIRLALLAADGRHWADCFVNLSPDSEFGSGMIVWAAQGHSTDFQFSGGGCGSSQACSTFSASWVDRLPAVVAAVDVETVDGRTTRLVPEDGFVVFNYSGNLEPGQNGNDLVSVINRVTYLDADGKPLAASAMDGSGTGEDHEQVGDLPLLTAYPMLRPAQAIY